MRAIILAAGKGSRLRPYTSDTPKPLTPAVDDTSILDYNLTALDDCDISEAIIVVGYLAEEIESYVSDVDLGLNIRCVKNEEFDTRGPLGSFITGVESVLDEPFLLLNGDTIYKQEVVRELSSQHANGISLAYSRDTDTNQDDMKVVTDQGEFEYVGKDRESEKGVSSGMIMVRGVETKHSLKRLLSELEDGDDHISEFYWHDIVNLLDAEGIDVHLIEVPRDSWWEIDTPQDLEKTPEVLFE